VKLHILLAFHGSLQSVKLWFNANYLNFLHSHWLTRIFLPSGHTPYGDGLTWDIYPLKKDMMPVWDNKDLTVLLVDNDQRAHQGESHPLCQSWMHIHGPANTGVSRAQI